MIEELAGKVLATVAAANIERWKAKSYGRLTTLENFSYGVMPTLHELIESFQGHMTMVKDVKVEMPEYEDFADHLTNEADWIETNCGLISHDSEHIESLVCQVAAIYTKAVYRLTRLK